jgi:hypothetical protein
LTSECSSRWAGWATKSSNDAYALARANQLRALRDKQKAACVIEDKLRRTVHTTAERKELRKKEATAPKAAARRPRHLVFGYRSAAEHAMKRQRLQALSSEIAALKADISTSRVHITRGGERLLHNRLHLGEAGLTKEQWRVGWDAKRQAFGANGEKGKKYGNETIRAHPDGTLEVDLPLALAHMANLKSRGTTRYRFDAKVSFSYRQDEWLAQVKADRAVAYDIMRSPSGRVYLDASFRPVPASSLPRLEELLADPELRVLAIDLNHGFLAPAVLDRSGNPVARLPFVPLLTEDLSARARDGHLRAAVTELLDRAAAYGCRAVVVEHLGFDDMRSTGRERYGSKKWSRKVVCSIPTAQFRGRLVAMASRRGTAVLSVPAAYSSIWGAEHWQGPLSDKNYQVPRHTAAAVVLGRRALGHSARRRPQASPGVTAGGQRTEDAVVAEATVSTAPGESYHVGAKGSPGVVITHRTSRLGTRATSPGDIRPEVATRDWVGRGRRRPFVPAPEVLPAPADRR